MALRLMMFFPLYSLLKEAAPDLGVKVLLLGTEKVFMRIAAEVELNTRLNVKVKTSCCRV